MAQIISNPTASVIRMSNRAFHCSSKGDARRYGSRHVPSVAAGSWRCSEHHPTFQFQPALLFSTAATPSVFHCQVRLSQSTIRGRGQNPKFISYKRSFSGTTTGKNEMENIVVDGIDRSKFTNEVKVEMPNVGDDDVKGKRHVSASVTFFCRVNYLYFS